jgi:hypothetical protein
MLGQGDVIEILHEEHVAVTGTHNEVSLIGDEPLRQPADRPSAAANSVHQQMINVGRIDQLLDRDAATAHFVIAEAWVLLLQDREMFRTEIWGFAHYCSSIVKGGL